ncbi:hypothetical protein Thimo_0498 [Thioflavicoccus mobilis 8321]|uniref:Uncharacterized protein n=1 Tax=Thioflavicoccus mobilis 8321 TaxID=765912 RepID=L0GRG6_9GAMM|nr:tetratricopeptide repeat protein [Thioflavicoccus mobilis]AGA89353.1 hypothetical protein Thimo_0498 [Thioflavicoccus mobilis 8321]
MNLAENSYRILRRELEDLVQRQDRLRLRALLAGEDLPALGPDLEPAELLLRAIEVPSFDANLARRLARLLTPLVDEQRGASTLGMARLATASVAARSVGWADGTAHLGDPAYLFNLFLLAARLPRDAGLFEALCAFFESGHQAPALTADGGRPALQLRRALCNQQTDDRLWGFWLGRLVDRSGPWNDARRSELMEAWRGLLWCLDLSGARQERDLARLDDALGLLHDRVVDEPRGENLLKHALMRLEQAFPTGVGSLRLASALRPRWERWPPLLKETALLIWPALEPHPLAELPPLPPELAELWNALSRDRQRILLNFISSGDAEGGARFLTDILFDPPILSDCPPQEVRQRISELSHRLWPTRQSRHIEQPPAELRDWREAVDDSRYERVSHDRLRALEGINRTLRSIEQRLARGDPSKARVFLGELIDQQRAQPISDVHIHLAKTLTKAATIARDYGETSWAEELYREAMAENRSDPVPANGLADVLKAKGDLDAAEAQYRDNMARWPGNEVAANGLAEVLKAKGDLDAAEAQYRDNMARWPGNEVAASGLAEVLKAKGDLDAAEAQYRDNMARWPGNEVAASGLAEVLKAKGDLDAAEAQYRDNMARWLGNEVAANGLAEVLKAKGDLDAAEAQYRDNMARWPGNEVAANGLAEVLKAKGDLDAAEAQYRDNMARWPGNEVAASGLAEVLKAKGDLDAAEAQYRDNMARWPGNEVAASGLAEVLKAKGDLDAAEAQYRDNMARWPGNEVAASGLAEVLKAKGDLDAAEAQYRDNIARWSNSRVVRNGLANVLRKRGHTVDALALVPLPRRKTLTLQDLYDLHVRALLLIDLGRVVDARAALQKGLDAARTPALRTPFERSWLLLDLRLKEYRTARDRLASMQSNVVPLELLRLHAAAGDGDEREARGLFEGLHRTMERMSFERRQVLARLAEGFCLVAPTGLCQPDNEGLHSIFDAEVEMVLAA